MAMEKTSIAIVGMSCRFAGADSLRAFWQNIISQRASLTPLSADAALPIGGRNVFDAPYPTVGGQLGELYSCRPFEQTFPRQMNAGENQDLYFITQLAFDALADAGMRPHSHEPRRGSVRLAYAPMFNPSVVNWLEHTFFIDQTLDVLCRCFPGATDEYMENVRGKLRYSLPAPNADALFVASGCRIAGWIAKETSFAGAATVLDAGVLSGVAALEAAADDLVSGRADVSIAGAVTPPMGRSLIEGLSGKIAFSTKDELCPFDGDACGTVPGEGGAFFVLKRRSDALAAHDRIYALLRGVATSSESLPIEECASAAGAPISTIAMIEADGAGFPEADAADIDVVQRLWGMHRPGGALVGIGSVKGNIGHCFAASAAASLAKVAMSLRMRVLPPQIAGRHPLESISNVNSSAYLLDRARPWIIGTPTLPRRAVVCANDFDGRRAAVLLEEEPENRR